VAGRYWLETLGCPKNQVDSDKLSGTLLDGGYAPADAPGDADLVVVNTCAFIEAARQESIDTILELAALRSPGARLVVTGCMAQRYGTELAAALPEVDLVAGFGVPVTLGTKPAGTGSSFDLLNLTRPPGGAPWAYVKVAEGCDRRCGFCAIPSFRGRQRSRSADAVLEEVDQLGDDLHEVVLVAQDLASWGLDRSGPRHAAPTIGSARPIIDLIRRVRARVARVRLLYLYPSSLDDALIEAVAESGVPYFDLSLQHVSRPLVQRMRRWGDAERFLERIGAIRACAPDAALRSSFILGYPGETEDDHDQLLSFLEEARLDWAGFFTYSEEPGTLAADLPDKVAPELAMERLRECAEVQDAITAERRAELVGERMEVLVDERGVARSHREAPEIDGIVHVDDALAVGRFHSVTVTGAAGADVWADAGVGAER
jgi:ribosomal protein S12 methylthiotransferase